MPVIESSVRETGCDFCRFLKAALSSREAEQWLDDNGLENLRLSRRWVAQTDMPVTAWLFQVLVWDADYEHDEEPPRGNGLIVLSFPVTSRSEEIMESRRFPRPVEPFALATAPLEFLTTSLDSCAGHAHPVPKAATAGFLPTRLVDVRSERPRVVELDHRTVASSSEEGEEEPAPSPTDRRYLALSYCWGGQSQLLLTRASEARLKAGFPEEELSPTQRDTVALARALSVPYVWIDALCIRQGDREDWEPESATMGQVYSGAFLTVCAVSSASCQEGYLQRDFVTPITIPVDPVSDPSGTTTGTYCFQPPTWSLRSEDSSSSPDALSSDAGNTLTHNDWGHFGLGNSLWSTRAWTFQEMMMSTRKLYFTTSGMHFVCSDADTPRRRLPPTYMPEIGRHAIQDHFGLDAIAAMEDPAEVYREWVYWVVMGYGARETTNPTDAFPSLSGLAHTFAPLLRDEYVAGFWAKRLASGLLWQCMEPPHPTPEALLARPYVGPSWSWVARCVAYHEPGSFAQLDPPDFRSECESLRAVCVPRGSDPCGELLRASLHIRTRAYPADDLDCWLTQTWTEDGAAGYQLLRKEMEEEEAEEEVEGEEDGEEEGPGPSVQCWFEFAAGDHRKLRGCLLLLVASYYDYSFERWAVAGLVVYPTAVTPAAAADDDDEGSDQKFVRIGTFVSSGTSAAEIEAVRRIFQQHETRDMEII
ncbi:hypothetical protein PG988_010391 [Apiospora saccharicola]